jgi:nitrate reductase alpha subunit
MNDPTSPNLARRRLLKGLFGGRRRGAGAAEAAPLRYLKPLHVENPLAHYPNRDWEKAYRNIFKPDSTFVFLCAPNDTHNCLLRAYVKNGVVARIGPTFGYGKARTSPATAPHHRWDPRLCQKGLALVRRIYGDRRVKAPMIRRGFKDWGAPASRATRPRARPTRSTSSAARTSGSASPGTRPTTTMAQASTTSCAPTPASRGKKRLSAQGYDPSMVEATEGAGVQTFKVRGGMAFLGATRIYGLYRFANSLALATRRSAASARRRPSAPGAGTATRGTRICPPVTRW